MSQSCSTNELSATKRFKPDLLESPLEISLKHPKKKSPNPSDPADDKAPEVVPPTDSQDESIGAKNYWTNYSGYE